MSGEFSHSYASLGKRFQILPTGKLVFHLVSSLSRGRGINIFPEKEVRHEVKSCQRQREKGNNGYGHQNPGFFYIGS